MLYVIAFSTLFATQAVPERWRNLVVAYTGAAVIVWALVTQELTTTRYFATFGAMAAGMFAGAVVFAVGAGICDGLRARSQLR